MRLTRIVAIAAPYVGITAATLVAFDLLCNVFGLFPPAYAYGDPDLGWRAAPTAPTVRYDDCVELSNGHSVRYLRNEDGVRTGLSVAQIAGEGDNFKIAVTGDSQTDLCAPNAEVHSGVLEAELTAQGTRAIALPYGVGRYSPLQDYLAYKQVLGKYRPDALVLNFYTGNDFYDLLRIDDRPHFVEKGGGYEIAEPIWYRYDDPRVRRRSRVLFLLESAVKRSGLQDLGLRLRFLYAVASTEHQGWPAVLAYMNDLRRAIEPSLRYPEAFAAQMLNQQLFFRRFPRSREESVRRARALMELARQENPDSLLILSALPSYELVQQRPVDAALLRTLQRLPITYEAGVQQEGELYETLRRLAGECGWLFVDNLAALRAYRGSERLYNDADYHLLPAASTIIGKAQAAAILGYRTPPGPRVAASTR